MLSFFLINKQFPRVLYENWRCDIEGLNNNDENKDTASRGGERSASNSALGLNKLTPRSTPPEEGANIQQVRTLFILVQVFFQVHIGYILLMETSLIAHC